MNKQQNELFIAISKAPELGPKFEMIGQKFGLHIDQIGELGAEIRDILRGISESVNFVKNISKRLEIDSDLAMEIAKEVNIQIFDVIKRNLQAMNAENDSSGSISALEKAGGFSVEKDEPVQQAGGYSFKQNVKTPNKQETLSAIENPGMIKTTNRQSLKQGNETFTEPLVEQLLGTPQTNNKFSTPAKLPTPPVPPTTPISTNLPVREKVFTPTPVRPQTTIPPQPVQPTHSVSPQPTVNVKPPVPAQNMPPVPAPNPAQTPPLNKPKGRDMYREPIN
jgi:hypothetical protein